MEKSKTVRKNHFWAHAKRPSRLTFKLFSVL